MPPASKSERDPRVDAYIAGLPDWRQDICNRLREIIHRADPAMMETIKRTVQPYFVLQGNVCALLATKDHVNLFLYDGAIVPDPHGIITSGHDIVHGNYIYMLDRAGRLRELLHPDSAVADIADDFRKLAR